MPTSDPDFCLFKDIKKYYTKKAKTKLDNSLTHSLQAGLGKLSHQARPLSIAELNYILQSDFIVLFEPR